MKNGEIEAHIVPNKTQIFAIILFIAISILFLIIFPSSGKSEKLIKSFSSFQALKSSWEVFDRLLNSGEIDETWEIGLGGISIHSPKETFNSEYIISYHRRAGAPRTLHFYFSNNGSFIRYEFSEY